MKKIILLLIILFVSCKEEHKHINFQQSSNEIALYSDVLIDLVENYYYNRYLGKRGEILMNEFYKDMNDTIKLNKNKIKIHNAILGDSLQFETIYLKDTIIGESYHRSNFSNYKFEENDFLGRILKQSNIKKFALIGEINQTQLNFKAILFHANTFKIKSIIELGIKKPATSIGVISFSKIYFFNKDNEGILSCDFNCGGKCGMGYIIHVKKINNHWKIIEIDMTWIS